MNIRFTRIVVSATVLAFMFSALPQSARAGMIGVPAALAAQQTTHRDADLARVQTALARADVQQQLQALGVDPAAAAERAAALGDSELAQLAGRLDQAPAGGDILALLGAVFVVLLILDLVGVTHVFHHLVH